MVSTRISNQDLDCIIVLRQLSSELQITCSDHDCISLLVLLDLKAA